MRGTLGDWGTGGRVEAGRTMAKRYCGIGTRSWVWSKQVGCLGLGCQLEKRHKPSSKAWKGTGAVNVRCYGEVK